MGNVLILSTNARHGVADDDGAVATPRDSNALDESSTETQTREIVSQRVGPRGRRERKKNPESKSWIRSHRD
jgi:hypothetical protein